MASIEDFRKLDVRVGEIKEARDHPEADRLCVLKVDIGKEIQLVAGIREHYSNEELEGKKVIVIANLDPATIRGQESQGMLLAAEDKHRIVLLAPDKDVKPGSKIR